MGFYANPLVCDGVSIVAAVRPVYYSVGGEPRGEIVDIVYDRLALAISHSDGRLMVARGNWNDWGPVIPDRQKTVVTLVVQPNGSYIAYVNGNQVMTGDPYGDFVSIPPDHTAVWGAYTPWASNVGFTHYISVGRNQPDGWSTFNGNIGDIIVYKVALTDVERQQLEGAPYCEVHPSTPPDSEHRRVRPRKSGNHLARHLSRPVALVPHTGLQRVLDPVW